MAAGVRMCSSATAASCWFHSRRVGPSDPDLYLNNDEQPRPGVHVLDSVLVPSKIPFGGR